MFNYGNESTRIFNKLLRNKQFMKMDLNKLVHNIDGISDTEDEDDTEEREDYYDIKKMDIGRKYTSKYQLKQIL